MKNGPVDQTELMNSSETWLLLVARVSDAQQRDALPAQKKRLLAYAEATAWPYAYLEFDESAYKGPRHIFREQVIDTVQRAQGTVIVAFDKIDRFSRDASSDEKSIMSKLLRQDKIELHFPADNLYITKDSPAADQFRLDIGVALAGYYSSAIRDNVRRRFDQKLADGEWPGKAPIGYENYIKGYDHKNEPIRDIKLDPERHELVLKGFQMRAAGMSYGKITLELRKAGLLSTVRGKPIAKNQVEHFLQNPFYVGTMRYEGKLLPHKYDRLVEPFLWRQVQQVDAARTTMRTKQVGKEFLFRDLIKCATCGYSVSNDGPKKGGNIYLKCTEYGGKHGAKWVNEKLLRAQVIDIFNQIQVPETVIPQIVADLEAEFETEQKDYRRMVERLKTEYDKIDEEIKDMFRDRAKFQIKPELFQQLVEELSERQSDVLERMKDHSQGNERFVISASRILDVASRAGELFVADTTKLSQKRSLLQFVLSNLRLEGDKLLFELKTPFDVIAGCSKDDSWLRLAAMFRTSTLKPIQELTTSLEFVSFMKHVTS